MSDREILSAVLDNRQSPHQPFVIITDSAVFSGLPVFKEALKRALQRGGPVLLVTALHPAEKLKPAGHVLATSTKIIDLTEKIPGYGDVTAPDIVRRVTDTYAALGPGGQIFIDDLDIMADSIDAYQAVRLIRGLLTAIKASKPPSRLITLLPHTSPILPHILPPTLSPTITHLHLHQPQLLTTLSKAYLTPINPFPHFWQILENARERRTGEIMACKGDQGVEVVGSSWKEGIVTVLVRKATGGAKGMSRSLAGVRVIDGVVGGLEVVDVGGLIPLNPVSNPAALASGGAGQAHQVLDLSFNLSLTDEQKRRRGEVPLPYAHEGEGPSGDVMLEFDDEEEEDDEEI